MKQFGITIFILIAINSFSQTIYCPPDTLYYACSLDDISLHSNLPYSETDTTITLDQLMDEGGNATADCGIKEISYSDTKDPNYTCPKKITRTFILTDSCDNVISCSQVILLDDMEPPSISKILEDKYIEGCNVSALEAHTGLPYSDVTSEINLADTSLIGISASDNCGIKNFKYFDTQYGFCPITVYREFFFTDSCGNMSACVQIINIDDTNPPEIACPPNATVECEVDIDAYPVYTTMEDFLAAGNTAADDCGIETFEVNETVNGQCPRIYQRTYTVTDSCGNTCTCCQIITVNDTTPPVITCSDDLSLQACKIDDLEWLTSLSFTTTQTAITLAELQAAGGDASDNCDIEEITYLDTQSGSCPTIITRTFTVSDLCGNLGICTQTIIIDNNTPLVFSCPPDTTIEECLTQQEVDDSYIKWLANADASLSGGCNATISNNAPTAAPDYCGGSVTVTWTITDDCVEDITCSATFTVPPANPPTVTCPPDLTTDTCLTQAEVDQIFADWVARTDATFAGGCNAAIYNNAPAAGPDYCGGSVDVTWTVTDDCANYISCTSTFTVSNTVSPTITCPPDIQFDDSEDFYFKMDSILMNFAAGIDMFLYCNYEYSIEANFMYPLDSLKNTIEVLFTVTDECGNSDVCSVNFIKSNNIQTIFAPSNNNNKLTCTIYPNPNEGLFTLEVSGNNSHNVLIDILNSTGKKILNKKILTDANSFNYQINFLDKVSGVYYVKISDGKNVVTKSIVIH